MARLYADENYPLPVVAELRRLGHDVATIQERGRGNDRVLDPEVLRLATAEGRAVLTINRRDFIPLHVQFPGHAGIVVCTQDPDFIGQAARIDGTLRACGDPAGQLLRVNRPG